MKKKICLIFALVVMMSVLCSCGEGVDTSNCEKLTATATKSDDKVSYSISKYTYKGEDYYFSDDLEVTGSEVASFGSEYQVDFYVDFDSPEAFTAQKEIVDVQYYDESGKVVTDKEEHNTITKIAAKDAKIDYVTSVNNYINSFVWIKIGLVLLLGTGILMTLLTKVFQISHIGHWFKHTIGSVFKKHVSGHSKDKGSISQFQALCTALAATIGVGNIAGVAAAIVAGGPGAVFWMWLAAFFGMMTNYSENVLGIFYRRKNPKGEWSGGAMYYLQDGLGAKKHCKKIGRILAILFSIFALLASFGIGNMGQVNKIVANIESAFEIKALTNIQVGSVTLYSVIIGVVIMILAALIILGGLQRIAAFAEKVVPFMVCAFILGSLVIIISNASQIGNAFSSIFTSAFNAKSVWGGAAGFALSTVITWGFKRGVFSNEAGLGSSVMVHSNSNVKEPVRQGMWGIFEVFADTMVVCTMTALVILTSGVIDLKTGILAEGTGGDSTLVAKAFDSVFSVGNINFGSMFIAIAILLFAFTTVLGWSHYGSKAWEYLFGTKTTIYYKVFFVLMIMSGALMTSSLAWDISDTFNGLMMIPNLIGVIVLSTLVMKITKNYIDRNLHHIDVKPMLSYDEKIQAEQEQKLKDEPEE